MTDDPRIDPADLRNVRFPGSSRRYDARSVDQFLETVAARIAATNVLVDELRQELADARAAAASPAASAQPSDLSRLDDEALVRLVGEETASVLATARRAAEEIRAKAEESAARMIREATVQADRLGEEARERSVAMTAEAEQALERATSEAQEAADRIRRDADDEAARTRDETRAAAEAAEADLAERRRAADAEVEAILEQAREEGRGMVAEAREVRARVLDDLQRRRDAARDQVERLLAGRERLLAAYDRVRENLDDITGQLGDALPDAAEAELPDGFAGAVGSVAEDADVADVAGGGAGEPGPTMGAAGDDAADEPDDTVAGSVAPGAEVSAAEDDLDDSQAGSVHGPDDAVDAPTGPDEAHDDTVAPIGEGRGAAADAPGDEGPGDTDPIEEPPDEPVEVLASGEGPPPDPDEPVEVVAPGPEAPGDVDALFARLRAEREQSVAAAQRVLADDPAGRREPSGSPSRVADASEAAAPREYPATETPEAAATATPTASDPDRVPAELLADEAALDARAAALKPLRDALNRALKRRLADEQNELLDLLRRTGTTDPAELLGDEGAQVAGYARSAHRHLAAASAAGAGDGAGPDVSMLDDALGRTLVEPFRRRVERAAADVDDAEELDERLRALYREWKAQHVGPAAEDALLSAYARGTLHAAGGRTVRWRIDPAQGPCPDAQDDALAGSVPAGEPFPTGDPCPQAHPGCRCLLVIDGT